MQSQARVPLSVIILTKDEELNVPRCLDSLATLPCEVLVVDSGSRDGTVATAKARGAVVVEHPFETHAKQWDWALRTLPLAGEWVLALDADQSLTPELATEIAAVVTRADGPSAYLLRRRQYFRGRWIRHGGYYPTYQLRLFRKGTATVDADELVDHHFLPADRPARLRHDLVESNAKENDILFVIDRWTRYAARQAEEEVRGRVAPLPPTGPLRRVARRKRFYAKLPLGLRACAYFVWRYLIRLGFLDGREGFLFHVLQGFWYRLLVDIRISELRASEGGRA